MANREDQGKAPRHSVPQFGAWDQKQASSGDYSEAFSRARAERKDRKSIGRPNSLGNHEEFLSCNNQTSSDTPGQQHMSLKKGIRAVSLRNLLCLAPAR